MRANAAIGLGHGPSAQRSSDGSALPRLISPRLSALGAEGRDAGIGEGHGVPVLAALMSSAREPALLSNT